MAFIFTFLMIFYIKFFKFWDRFILEFTGPLFYQNLFYKISRKFNIIQTADIVWYIFNILFFIVAGGIMVVSYYWMINSVYPFNEIFPYLLVILFFIILYEILKSNDA